MSKMISCLSGVFTADVPELHYTPQGRAVLKVRVIAEKYDGGKGENARYKRIAYHITVWGQKAEYLHPLLMAYINPNRQDAKPGVGCPITVFSNQEIDAWSFVNEKATTQDEIVTGYTLEMTAYDMQIHARLPEAAYSQAASASKGRSQGAATNADTGSDDDEDNSDIPF